MKNRDLERGYDMRLSAHAYWNQDRVGGRNQDGRQRPGVLHRWLEVEGALVGTFEG